MSGFEDRLADVVVEPVDPTDLTDYQQAVIALPRSDEPGRPTPRPSPRPKR